VSDSRWLLANPKRVETTSTRNDVSETRTTEYDYYDNGLLRATTREPDAGSNLELRTTFIRNETTWNVERVETVDAGGELRVSEVDYDSRGLFPTHYRVLGDDEDLETEVLHDDGTAALLVSMDPNRRVTTYAYDVFGRIRTVTEPTHITNVQYLDADLRQQAPFVDDIWGAMLTRVSSPGNGFREETIDAFGRTVRTRVGGLCGQVAEQEFLYDWAGRLKVATMPHAGADDSQGVVTYEHDEMGRLRRTIAADGRESMQEYVTFRSAKANVAPGFSGRYDVFAEVREQPNGLVEVVLADHRSLPTSVNAFDTALAEVAFPLNAEGTARNRYGYHPFNDLAVLVDPDGQRTEIGVDRLGRRTSIEEPSLGRRTSTLNAFGETIREIDAEERRTCSSYDSMGRLRETRRPAAGSSDCLASGDVIARFVYGGDGDNEKGRLTETFRESSPESGSTGTTTRFHYQAASEGASNTGLLEAIEREVPGLTAPLVTAFEYDGPRVSQVHYPHVGTTAPFSTRHDYDSFGNLAKVSNGETGTAYWELLEADHGLRLKREVFGPAPGIERTFEYYTANSTFEECSDGDHACVPGMMRAIRSDALPDIRYSYDRAGNVASRIMNGSVEGFAYDAFSRLVADSRDPSTEAFLSHEYDYTRGGDLTEVRKVESFGSLTAATLEPYRYEDAARPHRVTSRLGVTYGYDANGAMTSRTGGGVPGGSQTLHLAQDMGLPWRVTSGALGDTFLEYEASGARVAKRGASRTSLYAGDLYECEGPTAAGAPFSCAEQRYKVYAGPRLVAQVTRKQAAEAEATHYVHTDVLGSSSYLTNDDGDIVETRRFDAFGSSLDDFSSNSVRAGFTGHEADDDLGFVNMKGRLYDAQLRRFTSADPLVASPLDTQGINRYSYVQNNPLTMVDPSGFEGHPCLDCGQSTAPPPPSGPSGGYGGGGVVYVPGGYYQAGAEGKLTTEPPRFAVDERGMVDEAALHAGGWGSVPGHYEYRPGAAVGPAPPPPTPPSPGVSPGGGPVTSSASGGGSGWSGPTIGTPTPTSGGATGGSSLAGAVGSNGSYILPWVSPTYPEGSDQAKIQKILDAATALANASGSVSALGNYIVDSRTHWQGLKGGQPYWYPKSWGGNGAAGSRTGSLAQAKLVPGVLNLGGFGLGVMLSLAEGISAYEAGDVVGVGGVGIDIAVTAAGTFATAPGIAIGATFYWVIDFTVGWESRPFTSDPYGLSAAQGAPSLGGQGGIGGF
jgi:RHS repeat-associated protein